MINELKEIVELATNLTTLTGEILKLKPNNKNAIDNDIIIANKNNFAKIGSSGDFAQIGSSGNSAKIGSSGNSAQIGSSGYSAQIDVTGNDTIVCGIGKNTIIKGKLGTWITLAEYDEEYRPVCIKSTLIDGRVLKEDVYYTLLNGNFTECVKIDGIISIIINKHKNVYKVHNLGSNKKSYIIQDGDIYSHGDTIKEAKDGLLYKISNRDSSKYSEFTKNTKLTLKEAIEMYRVITGACEGGTRYFVENILTDKKEKYTVEEVLNLTQGQYNHEKLVEFFNK